MSTISIADLEKKSAMDLLEAAQKDHLLITANGSPIAMLLPISSIPVESADSILRGFRALQAQSDLQKASILNGAAQLTDEEIEEEIHLARRARKRK